MEFKPCKHEVVHFGRSNVRGKCTLNGVRIDSQRDLGVQVHRTLKVATKVDRVVKNPYMQIGYLHRLGHCLRKLPRYIVCV